MVEVKYEKNLFVLNLVGGVLSIIALSILFVLMMRVKDLSIMFIGIIFLYVILQLVEFLDSIVTYVKKGKIKKYSNSKVSIMKYKYLIW